MSVTIVSLAVYVHFMWSRLTIPNEGPASPLLGDSRIMKSEFRERCGRPTNGDEAIVTEILYSEDIKSWIFSAAEVYMARCPNTQLRLREMDDMKAVTAIVAGEVEPHLWVPSSSLALRYLEDRWDHGSKGIPLLVEERGALVTSPTVLFVWEDRVDGLDGLISDWGEGAAPWARSICAGLPLEISPEAVDIPREARVPETWLAWKRGRIGDAPFPISDEVLASWGRVSIEHTSPPRSTLGLVAIYLMAHDFVVARSSSGSVLPEEFPHALATARAELLRWLARCEAGREKPLDSALLLTETMFHVGDQHDGVLTSEHHVFEILDRINEHGEAMRRARVIYPEPSVILDYPEVFFWPGDPATREPREAAERFVELLRSEVHQRRAVERGLRPTNPRVSIRDHDVRKNPFLRLRSFGIPIDLPTGELSPPDGAALRWLVEVWEDATSRN